MLGTIFFVLLYLHVVDCRIDGAKLTDSVMKLSGFYTKIDNNEVNR